MKIVIPIILAIVLALGGFAVGFYNGFSYQDGYGNFTQKKSSLSNLSTETKKLHLKSFEVSKLFAKANILTQVVLSSDPDEVDYQTWQRDLNYVIKMWQEVETQSQEMDARAEKVARLYEINNINLFSIPRVEAAAKFDAKKINAIYDAAPAGRKIRTLAKQLNVDAKRAYKMLKMAQNQVTAEAWDEAGDTFETLENTARAIKDVSKVTVYVGGAALSGGSVSTVGTILSEGGAIIGGVDLLFEVGEDVSAIAFGYDHKSVAMLGDLRKITEPAASIIGLAGITNATNSFDRWSAVLFGADQINSAIQENKYLGIKVNFDDMVIESEGMNEKKMEKWLEKEKIEEDPSEELIKKVLDFSEAEEDVFESSMEPEVEQDIEIDDESLDTFDFIREEETVSEEYVAGSLEGVWTVVGVNSKSNVPDEYSSWRSINFYSNDGCRMEYRGDMDYSFDEEKGTGSMKNRSHVYSLEYGDDKNHLLVRFTSYKGAIDYWYLKKNK